MATRTVRLIFCLAYICARNGGAQQMGSLAIEPYSLRTYDGITHQVEIGRLSVPESRARPNSTRISVAFIRLKATGANPGSPIVFLMGGPGVAATLIAPIPPYWQLFDALRVSGDVILLDQRGLGLSSPRIDCPPLATPLSADLLSSDDAFIRAYRTVVKQCADYWRTKGTDPLAYTDAAIADDIDDIRKALGAKRVSLLGFSYGTRLAMTFARRHPNRLDRIVLQGPTDADLEYRPSLIHDRLLAGVARLAAKDSVAAQFSQNLVARLGAVFYGADSAPIRIRIRSAAGDTIIVPVGGDVLRGLVEGHITDSRIPAFVATAERGDYVILARWVEGLYNDLNAGAGSLMARAVTCSAGPSPARRKLVDTRGSSRLFGPAFDNFAYAADASFCSALGGAFPPVAPGRRRAIGAPALFITGEYDDRTSVGNDSVLAAEFKNSKRFLVAGGGHELLPDEVVQKVVVAFFAGAPLDGSPLKVSPPQFLSIEDAKLPPRRRGR